MARSFRSAAIASFFDEYKAGAKFSHTSSGRHYEVLARDGKAVQRRFELGANGREVHLFELEATHVIGSGNHARTYLHRSPTGEFIQLPLTWYTQEQSWGMSPGFDTPAPPDFTRLVDDSCLFCHNGYPREGTLAEGIDCQRCHGPGAKHVQLSSGGKTSADDIRTSIVNPKRLSAERQMDICMQCHLETTSAELPQMLRRIGREPFSFRPGEPLGDYMVHFDHASGAGQKNKFEIVNQAYRLRQSACFRESEGRMTCSSCHDPHSIPRGRTATEYYREKCVTCHATAPPAHQSYSNADCAACHMPKRRTEDAVHVVMTDHLIQRRRPAEDLLRPLAEQARVYRGPLRVYHPANLSAKDGDMYLGMALIAGSADRRKGIELLQQAALDGAPPKALAVLGEGYLAEANLDAAIAVFQRALAEEPALARARYNLARAFEGAGRLPQARETFEQVLRANRHFPEAHYALANLLVRMGENARAAQHYDEAIRQRPVYAEAKNNRGNLYGAEGRPADALRELEDALRINPAYAEAHNNRARVLAMMNRIPEALEHAKRAVRLRPDYTEARYNLARLLQETGAMDAALTEYRKVLAANPTMAEAHLALGQALGDAGRIDAAIAEFREVLRLRPGHAEAQNNLDMALSMRRGGH